MNENQRKHIATLTLAMGSVIFSASIAGMVGQNLSITLITLGLILSTLFYSIGIIALRNKDHG